MKDTYQPRGVIPACLLPFKQDLSIDKDAFQRHLHDVAATRGLSALTVNAHSTEVGCCSFDEMAQVLTLAVDAVGDKLPVVGGVFAESSADAARIARMSEREGASALLVFPPSNFSIGASVRPQIIKDHLRRIADATSLPLIYFQFPLNSGFGVRLETLQELVDAVPTIRAIKDYCNDPVLLEKTVRTLQTGPNPVQILTTHTAWLLASLVIGCGGVLSGSGSTVASLQVELFEAVQAGNLVQAKAVADRLYPLNSVFYADPFLDMHNRMKQAQVMLGRMTSAHVRPPLLAPDEREQMRIRSALRAAGLLDS
ncbi:dihydrodipicolinate synthase family protein [Ramlibacter ginsenosidimutans]|uniref:Dihydrodipicolinate synthase family protein n=1 Tax=Ramlibacter ginsenosidimutans TaxID=502333 RepID=A0A934TTI6_9BURK|nr:dihydrodipicolinate synthase family protein [Ramlibacter ginsenosidimutans]MBK6007149.1 dihydrodipicolinate synthase family protein [Ramlibacter ginsenosidimutans]